jgi:hypothetical protein
VALAIHTGVSHETWLDDPRAMFTAVELLEEAKRNARRR